MEPKGRLLAAMDCNAVPATGDGNVAPRPEANGNVAPRAEVNGNVAPPGEKHRTMPDDEN